MSFVTSPHSRSQRASFDISAPKFHFLHRYPLTPSKSQSLAKQNTEETKTVTQPSTNIQAFKTLYKNPKGTEICSLPDYAKFQSRKINNLTSCLLSEENSVSQNSEKFPVRVHVSPKRCPRSKSKSSEGRENHQEANGIKCTIMTSDFSGERVLLKKLKGTKETSQASAQKEEEDFSVFKDFSEPVLRDHQLLSKELEQLKNKIQERKKQRSSTPRSLIVEIQRAEEKEKRPSPKRKEWFMDKEQGNQKLKKTQTEKGLFHKRKSIKQGKISGFGSPEGIKLQRNSTDNQSSCKMGDLDSNNRAESRKKIKKLHDFLESKEQKRVLKEYYCSKELGASATAPNYIGLGQKEKNCKAKNNTALERKCGFGFMEKNRESIGSLKTKKHKERSGHKRHSPKGVGGNANSLSSSGFKKPMIEEFIKESLEKTKGNPTQFG